ncbi:MAG: universal stress protein [Flavobacteriales bacterium]|nr:universal stress protein [Flavobacteriales bacterium]
MKDILCPTDLTELGTIALDHAVQVAEGFEASITLLHVSGKNEQDGAAAEHVRKVLDAEVERVKGRASAKYLIINGHALPAIAHEAQRDHMLMVAGTHGARGLRQNLFGADILGLVRHAGIPSLVVQHGAPVRPFDRIVMPVTGHTDIGMMLDTVIALARVWNAEVEVYQLVRPGGSPSERLMENKVRMLDSLAEAGVRHQEVNEPPTVYSVGFAQQTLQHAAQVGAGLIAIMAKASDEYRYIADAEKERMLTNAALIPVLCC